MKKRQSKALASLGMPLVSHLARNAVSPERLTSPALTHPGANDALAVIYCVRADGWRYITQDGETQLVLGVSFRLQLLVG